MPLTMRDRVIYALTEMVEYSDLVTMLPGATEKYYSDATIVASVSIGDYSGEHVYLLKDWAYHPERVKMYAIVSLDFGSCSGCDLLEAIKGTPDIEHFITELVAYLSAVSVTWHTAEGLITRLRTVFTPENYWYLNDTIREEIADKFIDALVKDSKQPW